VLLVIGFATWLSALIQMERGGGLLSLDHWRATYSK
jgi:hypothetical protein